LVYVSEATEVRVFEAEDEELVWVGVGTREVLEKVVVVGDPEGVKGGVAGFHIGTEGKAFDFGGDRGCCEASGGEHLNDVQEERLRYGVGGCFSSVHVADVGGAL